MRMLRTLPSLLRLFLWCARKERAGRLNIAWPILLLGVLASEHFGHMLLFIASIALAEGLAMPLRVYNSIYREKRERRRYSHLRSAVHQLGGKYMLSTIGVRCIAPAIVISLAVGEVLLFRLPW